MVRGMDKAKENRGEPAVGWGYRGPGGPENWARLSKDFENCGEGRQQSPIDITGYRTDNAGEISFSYVTDAESIRCDGRFVHIDFPAGNIFNADGHAYQLTSAHFHTPSEHHIDGVSYVAELHLVHTDDRGNVAVVGQLFELGSASSLVQAILDSVPEMSDGIVEGSGIAAQGFLPRHSSHFRYDGSLTTPPCDEPVDWYVSHRPRTIAAIQVSTLEQLHGGPNNRPIQPIGNRLIALVG